jgi:glutathione S-transferase
MIGSAMTATALPTLVTIPISHYCEKARWALDRAGIAYDEHCHLPALHRLAVRRAGGKLTAPVLVCPGGEVQAESADIIAWVDARLPPERRLVPDDPALAGEAQALAADFDERFGPETRRWVYFGLRGRRDIASAYLTTGVPGWQRATFGVTYRPISFVVNKVLNITPETAAHSDHVMRAAMDEVAQRLSDGRRYLVGDRFTTADLTFAALAAPLVVPPGYGVPLPTLDELPADMAATVRELREHPAGAHALTMFRDERSARIPV